MSQKRTLTDDFDRVFGDKHLRIDKSEWDEIYVIGDVHGCLSELQKFVEDTDIAQDELLIFVGDLVRKGPDSTGVVEYVRQQDNMLSVRGNNEQKILAGTESVGLSSDQIAYIKSLPLAISWGSNIVVHGGLNQSIPIEEHSVDDLLNYRSVNGDGSYEKPLWFEVRNSYPRVFFGHTVLDAPFETEWAVGLDTGCVHGGGLTGYKVSTQEFVSVESKTYQNRNEDAIFNPNTEGL